MKRFIEVAYGGVANRNTAYPLEDLNRLIAKAQAEGKELYRSYYFYDETLKDHFESGNKISSFKGKKYIDVIILDVDKSNSTDEVTHSRAISLWHLLKDHDIDDINIRPYYSGTGYHFAVPNLWGFTDHEEVKATLGKLFKDCDPAVYNRTSLIRVANTINNKAHRYKIPLSNSELLCLDTKDILELAATHRNDFAFPDFEQGNSLEHLKILPKMIVKNEDDMEVKEGITKTITCVQKMYLDGPKKGKRHTSMLRMVSAFKRGGVPKQGIFAMMKAWAGDGMQVGEIRKIVEDTFVKNYAYSCNDEIMSSHCDERCLFYKKKSYNAVLPADVLKLEEGFVKSLTMSVENRMELQKYFGIPDTFKIMPEEYVVIQGDTGLGKSALIQNIVVSEKIKTLYLNFEVGENLMYRRFLQIAHGMTKEEVTRFYENRPSYSLTDKINHIDMISERITTTALENLIASGAYKMVVADTLECFNTPGINDITPKTEYIAHELKRLAKKYKIIIIAIHHISKFAILDKNGDTKKLNVHAGKGSSAVEQEADKVLLLEGEQNSPIRHIRSAKARDERPFQTTMNFDAERTFIFNKDILWTSPSSTGTPLLTSSGIAMGSPSHSLTSVVLS